MGKRLHSAVKYEIKYDNSHAAFNWSQIEINPIIVLLGEEDGYYDEEFCQYANYLKYDRKTMLNNLDKILHPDKEWKNHEVMKYLLDEADKEGLTRQYIYDNLKKIIEDSDPNCHYVHFYWF